MTEAEIVTGMKAAEIREYGKSLRQRMKRSDHAELVLPPKRDPVGIIEEQNQSRLQQLIPVRMGRMLQSNFAYYRGSAGPMAADLAAGPHSGVEVIGCGDAHAANFGLFAAPDRELVFDLNDFDESGPMPWEWDVKRLTCSVELGFRHNGFSAEQTAEACTATVRAYREALAALHGMTSLERYYLRVRMQDLEANSATEQGRRLLAKAAKKAKRRTSDRVLGKITMTGDGRPEIVEQPPILQHVDDTVSYEEVDEVLGRYFETLPPDMSLLMSQFELVDYALRVVGVGSVGTRCFIVLLTGPNGEPLFLQLKEAVASVAETYGGIADHLRGLGDHLDPSHGYRVVSTQKVLQAASDPFLGWVGGIRGIDFYVRQFRDMKGSADLDALEPTQFKNYAVVCAKLLARAHSQSPGSMAITGYLGQNDRFDRAVAEWSRKYADLVEGDCADLKAAVESGRLPAEYGV